MYAFHQSQFYFLGRLIQGFIFAELFQGEDMRASFYHAENDMHISQCCI